MLREWLARAKVPIGLALLGACGGGGSAVPEASDVRANGHAAAALV